MVSCWHAGQWFVRHGTWPIVIMTQNQVRVFFRSYRCPFAWFVRLARHHSQVAFLAFVVDVVSTKACRVSCCMFWGSLRLRCWGLRSFFRAPLSCLTDVALCLWPLPFLFRECGSRHRFSVKPWELSLVPWSLNTCVALCLLPQFFPDRVSRASRQFSIRVFAGQLLRGVWIPSPGQHSGLRRVQ